MLRDIHACPEILDVLSAAPAPEAAEIPAGLRTQKGQYLLLPGDSEHTVRNLTISGDSVRLLTFLEAPRSKSEIAQYIGVADSNAESLGALLGRLLDLGVLQHRELREPQPAAGA
ncbi:hypothetical protein [Streptomyces sp. NBC_00162]|uniref:hypothetical protein n=1 Tax=Streptomyces sp. NBC_00162 TaxID=2903629 RepID=UPI00214B3A24|nr:hypothetical protein [Streptomyces sp. NBC_00162]UUU37476.1 hypothetical protein JIW86_00115 [Streptomyces sp. NBC_00162]